MVIISTNGNKKAVEIRDLKFVFPTGLEAIKGINIEIYESECIAFIGPNGAGKSTLIMHLNGLLFPKSGTVRIFGEELTERNKNSVRRIVNVVFQDPDSQLFSPTVFDDVAFGPLNQGLAKHEIKERVTEALAQVGLSGFEERSPHHLSFGEKRRISFATVLSMRPKIMVLDEPTLGLDPWAREEFIELLKELKKNVTLILATHDLELLHLCNRAYLIKNGTIEKELRDKDIQAYIKNEDINLLL